MMRVFSSLGVFGAVLVGLWLVSASAHGQSGSKMKDGSQEKAAGSQAKEGSGPKEGSAPKAGSGQKAGSADKAGSRAREEGSSGSKQKEAFAQRLWGWLQKSEYAQKWQPWPGKSKDFYPGESPHGAFLKLYVNKPVLEDPKDPPHGSVLVKENYTEEKKLAAITIMYRTKEGFDPEHNDWYWVKYTPEGAVAEQDGMKLAGRVQGCIDCHQSAAGSDWIFTNDK